ncbi:dihydropteroate synthase (plasmid) [Klebsiella aerogenes]|nr:dihydropteroate synthase [Klebsiella aerogenes]WPS45791.1 dihydropteroate synthase [Klebsiella aerogenes]
MVTVFGILNLTEDSFFDESRRLDPAGAVTAAIEMLRVGSDVVDVGPAASHPDARPVSPADEIRRIAPLLDALSDQMHRVSIDSFQPETQRYALKRGVGYLNDIQGFPDPALYGTVAKLAMRQPFVLFKGLTFQKLCLPGAFRPGDHHNKMLRPGLCVVHASPQYL